MKYIELKRHISAIHLVRNFILYVQMKEIEQEELKANGTMDKKSLLILLDKIQDALENSEISL